MTILCYHAIEDGWTSPLAVSPAQFESHCAWLARHRTVVPLREALDQMDTRGRLRTGMVALTFDDGFLSVLDAALPILNRYRLPATFFVVAETLTPGGRAVDWVDTPPPYPMRVLSPADVLQLRDEGMEIGSHSYSHLDLTILSTQECVSDLIHSREVLEDLLKTRVPYLAYPRGRHNSGVREAAAAAGYSHSLALPEVREAVEAHAVPRVGIHRGNGLVALRVKTEPRYLAVRTDPTFLRFRDAARTMRGAAARLAGTGSNRRRH